ncbi:glyoxalase superfamily protein [Deinococcus cellulosilyticus]|uniref:Bleomycin resistance protein n=1 Tax=Deinococcus cellulosilyticus (strain DSM 18568 / NBRC 106333 / KACC 11606 / 5516J-15) TaxID=1223518 RepID=A0A511N441_DEIC1|nr:glyoxalase superfamily protein [Deinococcus cellulosilyticus]GEM47633.1 bleomycin resistance protein [Deinococcus cellulosilyticus NBRC 106333 = KACC 11606]
MQSVIPALRITNPAASITFYVDHLGFQVDWEHRFEVGFPVFMQVQKDGMLLYLTEHAGDCEPGGLVHFLIPDVDAYYRGLLSRNAPITSAPHEGIPGVRSMTLTDPDGNQLRFLTRKS